MVSKMGKWTAELMECGLVVRLGLPMDFDLGVQSGKHLEYLKESS
jgi:hypothetical protein